nr:reverse transcriptase domain-containing protein [Tanacetum cinerariifolium]
MRARSSSNLPVESPPNPLTSNPKRRNRIRSKQPFILEEYPVDTMADQRTMAKLLRAPTEGYAEAIVVPPILAEQFELKHSLINMMTSDQFFGLEKDNPHDHIRWFNKITSTIKYKDVPNLVIKLMLFPFSLTGAPRRWLEKEPSCSILTWEDLVSKFINEFFHPSRTTNLRNEISNFQQRFDESFHEAWDRYKDLLRACPRHGFTELHQLDTFYNALNPVDQYYLNSVAGGNQFERRTQDVLTIIKNKYKCLVAGGNTFLELRDNIQGYVAAAAVNYNQGDFIYRPLGSRSLPSNTIANPKGKIKAITTRSGIVLDGPSIPLPPLFINLEEDEPHLLKEFADELALITFPPGNDDLPFDIKSDLKEIEYLLHRDPIKDIDSILEVLIDQIKSDTENVYDDPFDSKGEKIKESKLLIDEFDLPSNFPPPSEYDLFLSKDFSKVDAFPSTNNKDKKLAISHASLMLKYFDPPLYELLFFKEVPRSKILLLFSSKNEEKVFKLGILTSKEVHSFLIPELSHQGCKVFKIS